MLLNAGKNVDIRRWTPEPRFGESSIAPRNIHFSGYEELRNGKRIPIHFSMSVLNRNITAYNYDYSKIETLSDDWSGARKYDEGIISPLFLPKVTYYKPLLQKPEEEEKEKEEEEEEEE